MSLSEKKPVFQWLVVDDQPTASEVLFHYKERTKGLQLPAYISDGLAAFDFLQAHPGKKVTSLHGTK